MPLPIRIAYTPPFDWRGLLAFYGQRAVPGIEFVEKDRYTRSIGLGEEWGIVTLRADIASQELVATVEGDLDPIEISARLRRAFDLDADVTRIDTHLARDPFLAPLVALRPALRVPGHWDPFETAIRAILGQQVSVSAARHLAGRLVERAGVIIGKSRSGRPHRLFPDARRILSADLDRMGMPGARVHTLLAMSQAYLDDPILFQRGTTIEETVARLCRIKGIGPWTAQYIAVRACREPDGFPAGDAGLLRGMAENGLRPSAAALTLRAEAWRPYRAYAAHHIWRADEANIAKPRGPAEHQP